ncbi:MAG: ATP-binding protein [Chloroflexota bacterium]
MKPFNRQNKWTWVSLRLRIVVGVAVPMMAGMVLLSAIHYHREQQLLTNQTWQAAVQLGEVINGSLRHAMLSNDHEMLNQIVSNIGEFETVSRLQIINTDGDIRVDSDNADIGNLLEETENGCVECHQYDVDQRPRAASLNSDPDTMRISTPILNDEECSSCHDASLPYLGMLLMDAPIMAIEEHILRDSRVELLIIIISILLGMLFFYFLIYWFVLRRVEKFDTYLESYGDGDFSVRMPVPSYEKDELDKLVYTFNHMADEIEQRAQDEQDIQTLRLQAVKDERERIARELHDGMAQLIGFVSAKASAIRLLIKNGKSNNAIMNLTQLEEAAQSLSIDVREAILGLKTSEQVGSGLVSMVQNYVDQFRKLSDLLINVSIPVEVEDIPLLAETELHILRIVQEALSNARKHAKATTVSLLFEKENGFLRITVEDNGIGFDPESICDENSLHFGLCGMRERTSKIGGVFLLESEISTGTRVQITLPLQKKEIN